MLCSIFVILISAMEKNKINKRTGTSLEKAPKIVSHIDSRFVNDGEAVTLSCRIIGAQNFDVVWLHNNKEIKPSKDFEYTNEANIYKLQIAEIFPEDSGTYTCEAFNDAGESFSTCTINVMVPGEDPKSPSFIKFPSSVTVQQGESAKFSCSIAEEPLELQWLRDGKQIDQQSPQYKFTRDEREFNLEIVGCTTSEIGQYQAKAIGKKGETFASFSVNVFSTES